jgi:hypothetical protein
VNYLHQAPKIGSSALVQRHIYCIELIDFTQEDQILGEDVRNLMNKKGDKAERAASTGGCTVWNV